jgi:hypothetical protein
MKKFFSILLTILIISMCSINVMAADVNSELCGKTVMTIGDWVYEAINGGAYWEIDEYKGDGGDIAIPRIVNDKMVVSIGSYCFLDNTTVKNVETSSPLWTVSDYAFLNCTSLESFECNFALKEIKVGAFYGTASLKSINLEDSVVTEISPHAFTDSGITTIKIPETCTKLGNYSFAQCKSLTNITIPDSVTEISDTAFANCSNKLSIICNSNSYAAQYAESKGITCLKLDQPKYGDSNSDGKFNIRDATAIQYYKIGQMELTDYGKVCADVDHNGKINVRDVTYIQMKLAKIDVPDECF